MKAWIVVLVVGVVGVLGSPLAEERGEEGEGISSSSMRQVLYGVLRKGSSLKEVRESALYGNAFPSGGLVEDLVWATERVRTRTPMLDHLLDSDKVRLSTMLRSSAVQLKREIVGGPSKVEIGVIPSSEEVARETCDGNSEELCRMLKPACTVVSRAKFEDDLCYCDSLAAECLACSEKCGWGFCSSEEFHPAASSSELGSCPPAGHFLNLYGNIRGLRGKRLAPY